MTHTSTEQERQAPIKMHPGDDLHLTVLMASHGLNFVTGKDREQLLAWGRDVWQAARASAVPDGWKLVPVEPTMAMLCAGEDANGPRSAWPRMLAAAPQPDHFRDATEMMLPTAQVLEPVEQRQLDIGKAIERACQELPEGAEIQIYLERGAGTVHMTDWDGNEFDHFDEDHDDFACRINAATDGAIAAEQVAAHVEQGGAAS